MWSRMLPFAGAGAETPDRRLMWLLGQKINYINMIAFPVILGIGVDDATV